MDVVNSFLCTYCEMDFSNITLEQDLLNSTGKRKNPFVNVSKIIWIMDECGLILVWEYYMDIFIVNFDQDLSNIILKTEKNLFMSSSKQLFVMTGNGWILAGACFVQWTFQTWILIRNCWIVYWTEEKFQSWSQVNSSYLLINEYGRILGWGSNFQLSSL